MRRAMVGLILIVSALASAGCGEGTATTPAPAPAATFEFENPMADGVVGEWARYRLSDDKTWQLTLVELNPGSHASRVEEVLRDPETNLELNRETNPYHPNHFLRGYDTSDFVITRLYPERIFVAGREWDCLCVEFLSRSQGTIRCWFSNAVPVVGLVKQARVEKAGLEVNAELIDWSTR